MVEYAVYLKITESCASLCLLYCSSDLSRETVSILFLLLKLFLYSYKVYDERKCFVKSGQLYWQLFAWHSIRRVALEKMTQLCILKTRGTFSRFYWDYGSSIFLYLINVNELTRYSKSSLTLTLNERSLNPSIPWLSLQFLNSWRVSVVP